MGRQAIAIWEPDVMATIDEALAIALANHRADRYAEAAALYRRILDVDASNADALHLLGLIEGQAGRVDLCRDLIGRALQTNPWLLEARLNLGNLLQAAGRGAEAAASWHRVLAIAPGHASAWQRLGVLNHGRGSAGTQQALRALSRAVQLDPTLADAHHDLGLTLRHAGRIDEAIASYTRAIATKAEFPLAHMNLANALLERGDATQARASLQQALAIIPASPECWYNLGNATHAMGDALGALACYRRADKLGLGLARTRVAAVLSDLGQFAEAEATLLKSLPLEGSEVSVAIEMLTDTLIRAGRLGDARGLLLRLASIPLNGVLYTGECLTGLAALDLQEGQPRVAAERLARVTGDSGWLFTVKSLAALHSTLAEQGLRLQRTAVTGTAQLRPRIMSSTLASKGRFAHNVLEYILLRLYAEKYGYRLETPDWVGGSFFELNDPPPSGPLPPWLFPGRTINGLITGDLSRPPPFNRDILSPLFLLEHKETYRARVQSWLRPRRVWAPYLEPALERLRTTGNTLVALHIRRGDFVTFKYPITETAWYVAWLQELWPQLDRPVLYLASDDLASVRDAFAQFQPLTRADVAVPWPGLEFLQDFHVLMNADIVGISAASGFSQLAARLNTRARLYFEPDMEAGTIRPFQPWTL